MNDYEQSGRDVPFEPAPAEPRHPPARIRAGRLWAGGIGTAVVMALLVIVAILLVRGVFGIPVLAPEHEGAYGTANTTTYALGAAGITLLATGLLHLLLQFMPSPLTFFYWITALCTAAAVILPFTVSADHDSQIATAAINLIAGVCLISVLGSVATGSSR
ncbi:DUF6069 family protein [Nocardia pseudobrasiliensis]|uniref:Uncharacterized protein n=1 Tax=Nocardia pseudobrasiliensis TaxID=45979 RepID=A0A370IC55_9NOCA|nr:DUF6069 family protein [Nocardia pseudobrasiliensis]RDI68305.1 hypothetical protein DFR76_102706 [Nocardia pseudobrasiliensis]